MKYLQKNHKGNCKIFKTSSCVTTGVTSKSEMANFNDTIITIDSITVFINDFGNTIITIGCIAILIDEFSDTINAIDYVTIFINGFSNIINDNDTIITIYCIAVFSDNSMILSMAIIVLPISLMNLTYYYCCFH